MKILKQLSFIVLGTIVLSSCNDLLDTDSNQYATGDEHALASPNDSVYSLFGVLTKLQEVGGNYFVLGELRGDLVDVTEFSDRYLREINAHEPLSKDNPYADVTPYYQVINNCNYIIAWMDTVVKNKALLPDYAAAVKIRAWTYFQLAKNYSTVRYYTEPVLDLESAADLRNQPLLPLDQIIDRLIPQVEAIADVRDPAYIASTKAIPSAEFLLGEFYLWKGSYEQAAINFKRMMEKDNFYICNNYFDIFYSNGGASVYWQNIFNPASTASANAVEVTSGINYYTTQGYPNPVSKMCLRDASVCSSALAIENWYAQINNDPNSPEEFRILGDLRGLFSWGEGRYTSNIIPTPGPVTTPLIAKYQTDTLSGGRIILERAATFALRYAEAVNRLGKPTLALAAINHGLKQETVMDSTLVNRSEIEGGAYVVDFNHTGYNGNLGVRGRVGLTPYTFPSTLSSLNDSILFVEDIILEESALETAFEGNRYTDLLRVALRREDPDFLADAIAKKFIPIPKSHLPFTPSADAETVKNRLKDKANYFIPFPQ
jgi:tetratricopeptide (TPR) repeat protein